MMQVNILPDILQVEDVQVQYISNKLNTLNAMNHYLKTKKDVFAHALR